MLKKCFENKWLLLLCKFLVLFPLRIVKPSVLFAWVLFSLGFLFFKGVVFET